MNRTYSVVSISYLILLVPFLGLASLTGCAAGPSLEEELGAPPQVLLYAPEANTAAAPAQAIEQVASEQGITVETVHSAATFSKDLSRYHAIIFLHTSGEMLNQTQQANFKAYIQQGGGFVGIGAAADTTATWTWYNRLVGTRALNTTSPQAAEVLVLDRVHPATKPLPARWNRRDRWTNYAPSPRGQAHILATVNEKTFENGSMAHDHPVVWAQEFEGGRVWYTGLGATAASYTDSLFRQHLAGGLAWAAGLKDSDVGATLTKNFKKVVLDSTTTRPNELDVAPDGRVFYTEREGAIKVWDPQTQRTQMAGFLPVKAIHTNGLIGMTLDPNFEENSWIYLYYSPRADDTKNILARFTVANNRIEPASQQVILEVPTGRYVGGGAHSGGSLAFGPEGNLFLSTGDNTNPEEVELSTPIDERPGREHWDAQRTAGNTMSLRGKILRIRPLPEGGYEVPKGNLFPYGAMGRPEIFTMGHRNPFRIAVDPKTGWLYWGDYGPSASPTEKRGAEGYDEFNQARKPGFYGWPYFVGNNRPFRDYDFATDSSGAYYNPEMPINESPNNTGARILPPAKPAMIWYPSGPSKEFPEMGVGGRGPMGGAVYRYNEETVGSHGLPAYYDGSFLVMEFMRGWLKEIKLDDQGHLLKINPFLDEIPVRRPFDMDIGPDGAVYLIEWGKNYEGWFNDNAQIVRLEYRGGKKQPPKVSAPAAPTPGSALPKVTINWPLEGGVIDLGRPIDYQVSVQNGEDRSISNDQLEVLPQLAHDSHWHRLKPHHSLQGSFEIPQDKTHLYLENLYGKLTVSYTKAGGQAAQAPSTQKTITLQPRRKEAAHVSAIQGAQRIMTGDWRLRKNVETFLDVTSGNYVSYGLVNLRNINSITLRAAPLAGGNVALRLGAPDGKLLGRTSVEVPGKLAAVQQPDNSGGAEKTYHWQQVTIPVSDPGGAHELFLVFEGADDKEKLMRLDWLQFNGPGMMKR